jgi:hypothetical protein
MKKRLVLLVLPVLLLFCLAAPSQAGTPSASPALLDFGTFPVNAPPTGNLTSTISFGGGAPDRYVSGLKVPSGGAYFYPSTDCPEAQKLTDPCQVRVHMNGELPGTGHVLGVVELQLAEKDLGPVVESVEIAVQANITAASTTTPPPPAAPAPATAPSHAKKKDCKKAKAKKKPCRKGKAKGKHKGKGKR